MPEHNLLTDLHFSQNRAGQTISGQTNLEQKYEAPVSRLQNDKQVHQIFPMFTSGLSQFLSDNTYLITMMNI